MRKWTRSLKPLCRLQAPLPPHRIRNEIRQAKEKIARLMQSPTRNDETLRRIQAVVFPDKPDAQIDSHALAAELRALADFCDARHQLATLPPQPEPVEVEKSRKKPKRVFEYESYRTRFVALHVMYLGWDFQGFASQDCAKTNALLRALKRTKLIPEDYGHSREIRYSRCGRTDKGVSALGQVVSLVLRSRRRVTEQEATIEEEFDYPTMLNAALPPEIRVWGWAPVHEEFSARYAPLSRTYKYFIIKDDVEPLDIDLMKQCSSKLLGKHNFQNFCKMNLDQTMNHEREIIEIGIEPIEHLSFPGCDVYVLTIKGTAFLWHQVRCIVEILWYIGRGLENPDLVDDLLDVEMTPAKPLYKPASEIPLVLWEADYGEDVVNFRRSHMQLYKNRKVMREAYHRHLSQLLIIQHAYEALLAEEHDGPMFLDRTPAHVPLRKRQTEPSFAERMEKRNKRYGIQLNECTTTSDAASTPLPADKV